MTSILVGGTMDIGRSVHTKQFDQDGERVMRPSSVHKIALLTKVQIAHPPCFLVRKQSSQAYKHVSAVPGHVLRRGRVKARPKKPKRPFNPTMQSSPRKRHTPAPPPPIGKWEGCSASSKHKNPAFVGVPNSAFLDLPSPIGELRVTRGRLRG